MNLQIFNYFFALGQMYPAIGSVAVFISGPLSFIIVPFLMTLYLFITSRHKMTVFALMYLSLFSTWLFARIIKELIQLERPFVAHTLTPLLHASGYSFPSEHAAVYGALATLVLHIHRPLGYVMVGFLVLVMLSRVIVGAHYPIDVLVGALLGIVSALFFIRLISKII